MTADEIFDRVMEWEGGGRVHTVPGDPGGTTKWGVSKRAYPHIDIPALDMATAERIFLHDYYRPVRADQLPEELRYPVVDFAFNAGVGTSARKLQQAVNLCKEARGRTDFLKVDGQLGPITLGAIDDEHPARLRRVFIAYRIDHYMSLAETGRAKFVHGWLRRAMEAV